MPGADLTRGADGIGRARSADDIEGAGGTVTVVLPRMLVDAAGGQRRLAVALDAGATVADLLDRLGEQHPRLERRVRDEAGGLRRFVNVYLDGEEVRGLAGPATPVRPGQEIRILQSVAGG